MTAIAIWHNHEIQDNPSLWITADSLISSTQSVLIGDGAKIFPLSVVCKSADSQGFFSRVYHSHTYGYCFAGSTLMGQNTYLAISPLLSNLISPNNYVPSLSDIARHALAFLRLTFDDYKFRVSQDAMLEVAIFGYCPCTHQLSVIHFAPKKIDGVIQMSVTAHPNMQGNDFVYLGDDKARMTSAIASAISTQMTPASTMNRIPRQVIQNCINDEAYPTIGGDIQLGIADKFGFRPYTLCKPRVVGQGEAYFSYLGRELTPELRFVGEALVGTNAMM